MRASLLLHDLHKIAHRDIGVDEVKAPDAQDLAVADDVTRYFGRQVHRKVGRIAQKDVLASPAEVRAYLRVTLAKRDHEVFMVLFLDAQNRVIASEEMFRGTLTQTSVYPREVVKRALAHNAAAVILAHNHPASPSPAGPTSF